jgi:hypothetical protein
VTTQRFIFKVSYRGTKSRRVARFFVKVPYGGAYVISETLMRAWTQGLIDWYRVDTVKPGEITEEVRASLTRWPEALRRSTEITKVEFGT